ncbi:heterodisulfide reductase-related iron-sulfur binding cluster [Thermosulfuriphilus sp.]
MTLIKESLRRPLKTLRVAPYYGCQYSRPSLRVEDDAEYPQGLDALVLSLGAEVINFSSKAACCGAAQAITHEDVARRLVKKIILEARHKGADLIVTICPLCQFNLEVLQLRAGLRRNLPVIFFSQLIGLALGLPEEGLGFEKLLIPLQVAGEL